jgi:hypothetical protein
MSHPFDESMAELPDRFYPAEWLWFLSKDRL